MARLKTKKQEIGLSRLTPLVGLEVERKTCLIYVMYRIFAAQAGHFLNYFKISCLSYLSELSDRNIEMHT